MSARRCFARPAIVSLFVATPILISAQRTPDDPDRARIAQAPRIGVPCQSGFFRVPLPTEQPPTRHPRMGPGGLTFELLNGKLAIVERSELVDAHLQLTSRGTEVSARWPSSAELPDGAQLDAVIDRDTCTQMSGRFQAVGEPIPFTAIHRLLSDDDVVGGGDSGNPDEGESESTGGHNGFRRWYTHFIEAATPGNLIPPDAREKGHGQTIVAPIAPEHWVSLGPGPFRRNPGDPTVTLPDIAAGRVNALAVDPWDSGHWLIGAAMGGVWETHDAGATWTPRTDDQPSLAISAIAFAPSAPNVVFAGTGYYSPLGSSSDPGVGILKSIDGGHTWSRFGISVFTGLGFGGIAVSPTAPGEVVAATVRDVPLEFLKAQVAFGGSAPGVYRSGTGGSTWELKLAGQATAVVSHPTAAFFFLYAGLGKPATDTSSGGQANQRPAPGKVGVYRSLNGGQTWQVVAGPWTGRPGGVGEVRLAISPSNPDVMYVSVRDAKDGTPRDGYLLGVWRTGNAWDTTPSWTELPTPSVVPYGGHDILVHGQDSDILYVATGGPVLWKYTGSHWITISQADPNNVNTTDLIHVDHRALAWVPPLHLLVGNDGGIYLKNEVDAGPWLVRNEGLAIAQMPAGDVLDSDPTAVLGGAVDLGVGLMMPPAGKTWKKTDTGDGMGVFFGPIADQFGFFMQQGGVLRTLDGGTTSHNAIFGIPQNEQAYYTRAIPCPSDRNVVLYGATRVWKTANFFVPSDHHAIAWASKSDAASDIVALAFAPSDATCKTYAFVRKTGRVYLTLDDGAHWSLLNPGAELPNRWPTSLAFGPSSASRLWVTFSGFDAVTPSQPGHLFRTDDATSAAPSWQNVSPPVDLPNRVVAPHPTDPNTVIVGTDLGLWTTNDAGVNWKHAGPSVGLPNVTVMDVHIGVCGVTAFTYGRGAFRSVPLVPCGP